MDFDIPESELQWSFGPSGGPGGQHANRSNTRAELLFDIEHSGAFDDTVRRRLTSRLGQTIRITEDGSRSQATNRKIAKERLAAKLSASAEPDPPKRKNTRPSYSAKRKRLDGKRARGQTKQMRKRPSGDD